VGSSSEGLDPAFDEGSDKLKSQKFLLWSRSKLLDFLHQRLRDLHLFIQKIMPPGYAMAKYGGVLKFFEPEVFAVGELVLGVELLRPPARVVFGHLEGEVRDVQANLAAEAASLVLQRAPNDEDSAPQCPVGFYPQCPVGFYPQETFTERDETRYVKNCVGIQVMELNPVSEEEATEKRMRRQRQTLQQKGDENYLKFEGRPGNNLRAGGERFRRRVLQEAHILDLG
jgi:hypothetical protein